MIKAADAIRVGRQLLGTPYGSGPGELDCINFIKKIIRTAPGGDKQYTDAHVPALWASYTSSGKYRHLIWIQTGVSGAMPGMLAFKGKPLGRDGEPSHVGLVTSPTTVIHSSSAKGCVVETDLLNGQWTLLAEHKLIIPGADQGHDEEDTQMETLYQAKVVTESGNLNLRSGPSKDTPKLGSLPPGSIVSVLKEYPGGWDFVESDIGIGYASSDYLQRIEQPVDPDPDPDPEPEPTQTTALINDDGTVITLMGIWRVADD